MNPAVIVEFHPATFDEFFTEPLKDYPSLAADIMSDFILYKGTGKLPARFGRDAPYIQPIQAMRAQLMHIHLALPPDSFPDNLRQYDRVSRKANPNKDAALIYVRGELEENRYCLLGVLYPDAHALQRRDKLMRYLARLAQAFRDDH